MKFISGTQITNENKIVVSKIFAKAFYQWLKFFSKDTDKLALAFENAFVMDKFYFAMSENRICGMAACTDGRTPSIKLVKKDLVRALGFIKGNIANKVLKGQFENHPYPFELTKDMLSIEFVSVDDKFRNQGVASGLIKHIIEFSSGNEFVLEVADTNIQAVNLYNKLGFIEFMRVSQKHPKQSGINNLLYMKYTK